MAKSFTQTYAAGPAGIDSGLKLWLSATSGTKDSGGNSTDDGETVETWEDQSTDVRTATRQDGSAVYGLTGLNYNPTLDFTDANYTFSDTGLPSGSSERSIFVVASTDDIGNWRYVLGAGTFGGGNGFDFGNRSGSGTVFITTHSSQEAQTGSWSPLGSARLAYGSVTSGTLYIAVNGGDLVAGGSGVNTVLDGAGNVGANSGGSERWDGKISEVIMYNRTVTSTERQRINSYLALKYGFSLDQSTPQSYLASGSNLMWDKDASGASTYDNGLFGIGRDDDSNLAQIKSRGQTSTNVIILEAVNEGANGAGSFVDMANLEFLVIGDNGGNASWTTTGAPTGYSILERSWKKQEQGDVGQVRMDFDVADSDFNIPAPLDADDYYFVYDTDNDGSLADETPLAMSDQGSNLWRTTVDFGAGGLFSLASTENPAITNLSPSDNATDVSLSGNLIITFSQSVVAGSGNVVIRRFSDDSIFETIAANSGQVTGTNSNTITINPAVNFASNTAYYVVIGDDAFENGSGGFFGGIASKEAWNFTAETVSTPSPTPDSGSSQSNTSNSSPPSKNVCNEPRPFGVADLFQINRAKNSAKLYFTPANDNVEQYHVVFGFWKGDERFGQIGAVVSKEQNNGVQSITVNELDPKANYWFKVIPVNSCAVGDWSNWLETKTVNRGMSIFYRWFGFK